MTLSVELTKLSKDQWTRVARVVVYSVLAFGISLLPTYFAHNKEYLSLGFVIVPILSTLEKLFINDSTEQAVELSGQDKTIATDITKVAETSIPEVIANPSNTVNEVVANTEQTIGGPSLPQA